MTLYQYRAVTGSGEIVEGELEAATRDAVIEHLHRQGHTPIRADAVSGASLTRALNQPLFAAKRVSRRDMVLLTSEIATLLQAGLPLERSLEVLIDLAEAPAQRSLLNQILDRIRSGGSLADALAEHERVFPRYYVSMVRAGEAGGSVEQVMARLADFMERGQKLRESVRSALIYPIIVVVMAGLSVMVLLTVVLPQFTPMFEEAGQALPLITQIVIAAGDVVQSYWWAMAGGLAALILGIRLRLRVRLRIGIARQTA
jgi:general secretion pathway protein F